MFTQVLSHAAKTSEFVTGLNGDCVETAMAVATGIVHGTDASEQSILAIVRSMQGEGIASPNGATSINNAHAWLVRQGYAIAAYVPYAEPFAGDWLALLRQYAGNSPIVLNVANAQSLADVETGAHDEVGVHYHGLCVVGRQDDGYVCVDGDNPQASQRYQIYPRATIEAAKPCGMIVLAMPAHPTPTPAGGHPMPLPAGWHDDGTLLTGPAAPDGHAYPFRGGMREQMLAMLANGTARADDMALQAEHDIDPNRIEQTTNYHRLVFSRADATAPWEFFLSNIGAGVLHAEAEIVTLQAQLAQAQAEITALKQQPTSPADPKATAALAAIAALKAAFAD